MNQDIAILNQIRQNVQMGQIGIRAIAPDTGDDAFREALKKQYIAFDRIHAEADALLRQHRGQAKDISAMAKINAKISAHAQQKTDRSVSKIAEMLVEGNTKGMIKSMRSMRALQAADPKVNELSNKLLQFEQQNIETMKRYL